MDKTINSVEGENANILQKRSRISPNISDAREILRQMREDNIRRSDDVIEIWEVFIRDANPGDLGDERWMILEQVGLSFISPRNQSSLCLRSRLTAIIWRLLNFDSLVVEFCNKYFLFLLFRQTNLVILYFY